MANIGSLVFLLVILFGSLSQGGNVDSFSRKFFPKDFVFGVGSAAYQYEGAALEDGRAPSIWDTFVREHPEKIADASTGDVAEDFYHRYKEDVAIVKRLGLDAFRFSISWSRVLPSGKVSGGVNQKGVDFYNNLINEIIKQGLAPYVTLLHFDTPEALEKEYLGFLSPKIVEDYKNYADFAFKTFGDRVKHWFTINEPSGYATTGYEYGVFPPARCSDYLGTCSAGNSATEPYIVAHYLLLSHAAAVKVYRDKYQVHQKGQIGITLPVNWVVPISNSTADKRAMLRSLDFSLGWFLNPVTFGDYPPVMRSLIGKRLPKFSKEESKLLAGSNDFVSINYYSANYVANNPTVNTVNQSYSTDSQVTSSVTKDGAPIGTPTVISWLYIYPEGIRELLLYIKAKYNDPIIHITENGVASATNNTLTIAEDLKDGFRISYIRNHLLYIWKAIQEGVKVKAYFPWTLLDDFEWTGGYTYRFGLVYVDFKDGLKRYPKDSAHWYSKFLEKQAIN